jgi:replication factor A1
MPKKDAETKDDPSEENEKKIKVPTVPDEQEEEMKKVEEFKVGSRGLNAIVKVDSISEVREVVSRRDGNTHRVADALVGDETACLYLSMWDNSIDEISEGDTLKIQNAYISLFKGSMRLNLGRYGSFEVLSESPISEVNTENNLSDKTYEQERRYPRFRPSYGRGYRDRQSGYRRRSRR